MTIKHLVFSGGGPTGFLTYGAASHLSKAGFWNLSNIESIYGCSIGAYIGFILSLGYEFDWLDDYLIKRPWNKVVSASSISLVDIYGQKGLLNEKFFIDAIIPLLKGKDLNENITLGEFYEFNHIDLHFYTTNINSAKLDKVDLSHTTHPNLSIVKALRMTMAFPIIFQPVCEDDGCYVDGGLLNNFPLNDCINIAKCSKDEILAFKNIWKVHKNNISDKSSMINFFLVLLKKMQASIDTESIQEEVKYTVRCLVEDVAEFETWNKVLENETIRQQLVEKGYAQADLFLSYQKNK